MADKQGFQWGAIRFGTAYYPEQWDAALWEDDLRRMLDARIDSVRIGDFSWSIFEPREGEFSFELFDAFLAAAEKAGMKVIFTTPTAAPPAWLTRKYPEVLNHRRTGVPFGHGGRRNYTYNSPKYRELCAALVEQLARHYGPNPLVVGWQIDNELNCEASEFYSDGDAAAFRAFLQKKYGTLEELNRAWGTVFWSQTYTDWQEVELPCVTTSEAGAADTGVTGQTSGSSSSLNPHRLQDYYHFVDESCRGFCHMQSEILRRHVHPGAFITTNGTFPHLDSHAMTRESLDVFCHDTYPGMAFRVDGGRPPRLLDRTWSMHLSQARSVSPRFGISEQQSGAGGWNTCMLAPAPKPGQIRLWTAQSIAHGAEYICYFRWRTSCLGTEINWHGILDQDNRDNRRLAEIRECAALGRRLEHVAGSESAAAFAVAEDYDNQFDAEIDLWHGMLDAESRKGLFAASQRTHTPMDYVWITDTTESKVLERYRAIFYPHPCMISPRRAALLRKYVERGGTLVLGAHAGCKDLNGRHTTAPLPGLLSELAGAEVREATMADPAENRGFVWDGRELPAPVSHDILASGADTRVLGTFLGDYYRGESALTEHALGKGRVLTLGAAFTAESAEAVLDYLGLKSPWNETLSLPEECELTVREKDGERFYFVLNYSRQEQTLRLDKPLRRMDDETESRGNVLLPAMGVAVFRENAAKKTAEG